MVSDESFGNLAMPKSVTLISPFFCKMIFWGLMSAMNHALAVRVLERAEDLADVNAGLLPRERAFFIEVFLGA